MLSVPLAARLRPRRFCAFTSVTCSPEDRTNTYRHQSRQAELSMSTPAATSSRACSRVPCRRAAFRPATAPALGAPVLLPQHFCSSTSWRRSSCLVLCRPHTPRLQGPSTEQERQCAGALCQLAVLHSVRRWLCELSGARAALHISRSHEDDGVSAIGVSHRSSSAADCATMQELSAHDLSVAW